MAKKSDVKEPEVLPALREEKKSALVLIGQIVSVLSGFKQCLINTLDDYSTAANDLKLLKDKAKELAGQKKRILDPIQAAREEVSKMFEGPEQLLKDAINLVSISMLKWKQDQERAQLEAKRKADEEAKRQAQEARRKMLAEAQAAMAAGKEEEAAQVLEQAAELKVEAAPVPAAQVAVKGAATRKNWFAEIKDPNRIPREFMCPDIKKLNEHARNYHDTMPVEGVEFKFTESVVSTRVI